jgi:diguanylate cyclase (GGDEF)-like protein
MAFRYGGEEFVILLSNTCIKGAHLLAERIRNNIANLKCTYNGNKTGVTVSLGVACLTNEESETDFFHRTDKALYEAKNSGRNCTKLAKI